MPSRRRLLKSLGQRLKGLRIHAKLTQQELGERCGLTAKYISELERGLRNPSLVTLQRLARTGLRTSLAVLVLGIDETPEQQRPSSASAASCAGEDVASYSVQVEALLAGRSPELRSKTLAALVQIVQLLEDGPTLPAERHRVRHKQPG